MARTRELAREPMPGEIRLQWWRDVLGGAGRGEIDAHASMRPDEPSMWRAWEYWAVRAGCRDLLTPRT